MIIFHTISCPLYNLKTVREISVKLGTLIKHDETMCHAQELQLLLSCFWSYFPLIIFYTISCLLYSLKTIRNISMKLGTLIKLDVMISGVQLLGSRAKNFALGSQESPWGAPRATKTSPANFCNFFKSFTCVNKWVIKRCLVQLTGTLHFKQLAVGLLIPSAYQLSLIRS